MNFMQKFFPYSLMLVVGGALIVLMGLAAAYDKLSGEDSPKAVPAEMVEPGAADEPVVQPSVTGPDGPWSGRWIAEEDGPNDADAAHAAMEIDRWAPGTVGTLYSSASGCEYRVELTEQDSSDTAVADLIVTGGPAGECKDRAVTMTLAQDEQTMTVESTEGSAPSWMFMNGNNAG